MCRLSRKECYAPLVMSALSTGGEGVRWQCVDLSSLNLGKWFRMKLGKSHVAFQSIPFMWHRDCGPEVMEAT